MKVLQINSVVYGSTGHIMFSIADILKETGNEVLCTAGYTWKKTKREDFFLTCGLLEKTFHMYGARLTGYNGCFSKMATKRLLNRIEEFRPDIIHLHNIHGWYLYLPDFFDFINQHSEIKVVWTLHDCWAVTGQCPHFTMIGCDKWTRECFDCPQCGTYPETYVDRSTQMFRLKKKWFSNLPNLTIITPSDWLKKIIEQSFLKEYSVRVINNGINTNVFFPLKNRFREKNQLENRYIVLGIAYAWNEKKGLDVFVELAKGLPEKYVIVLVGTDEKVDKLLPKKIVSIHRTQSQKELAEIYSAADVFVNPTREENYPTVNMEALACGTPVITFDTGGSAEMINEKCGSVIPYNDVDKMEQEIRYRCEKKPFLRSDCLEQAKKFDEKDRYKEYLELYKSIL